MNTINTKFAPEAIGPYSQAKKFNRMIFTSGQIPIDPSSNTIAGKTIEEQTKQVINNLEAVLKAADSDLEHVIKATCFLSDMDDFQKFNLVYAESFTSKPARSCVAVKTLPKNVLVEIELIAEEK